VNYTLKNLRESEDFAQKHGHGEAQEARFPAGDLGAEATGLALIKVKPNQRQPFAHRHNQAEEIYVVISGSGRFKLDDELVEVGELDAVRIEPKVVRAAEAGPDGLEFLAFGPRHQGDAEMVEGDFWSD
jgi:mannose-6-phosphate isomerase-like protein (cupin superfamily)